MRYPELPRTRAAAQAANAPLYYTGKACKHGHVARRITSCGRCLKCYTLTLATPKRSSVHVRYRQQARQRWFKLPLTRAEARERGVKRYYTDKACKHGHYAPRSTKTGHCLACRVTP